MVVELLVKNGQTVRAGSPIADLEGAKSSYLLVSRFDGDIFWYVSEGDAVRIGAVAAAIVMEGEAPPSIPPARDDEYLVQPTVGDADAERFSKSAQRFLAEKGLNPREVLPELGYVTLSDIQDEDLSKTNGDDHLPPRGPLRVALLGGGRGAEVVREMMGSQAGWAVTGVFDDRNNALESFFVPRIGNLNEESMVMGFDGGGFDCAVITITSDMAKRIELLGITERLGIPLVTLIDRGALVSGSAIIGEGSVAVSGSRIGASATLGKNVFLSAFVNIEHHCVIGENTTFGPGVFLSGGVKIGGNSVFGTNRAVEPGVTVGESSVIASGATITHNVPPRTVVKTQSQLRFRDIE